MNAAGIFRYYSRDDVQQALLRVSEKREVVGVFKDGGFSARPNTLVFPQDIIAQVRGGAVAFHGSLERWTNPMSVGSENYESGRIGWDLVLDIDCEDTEHGKVAAGVFIAALRKHGVKSVFVKFTGGTGFHIAVPFGAFPAEVDYRKSSEQYPGLARKIAQYLRQYVRADMEKALLARWSVEDLAGQAGKPVGSIMTKDGIDPFQVANVDPVLISPRHLFRLPYSLHEKSHLVSVPLRPDELGGFKKEDAAPDKARLDAGFLDRWEEDEAAGLVVEASDWWARQKSRKEAKAARETTLDAPVPLELAPPCIKAIDAGLSDGKKRSVFILVNYLSSLKWGWDRIEEYLINWNQRNKPPLPETYVRGQARWHRNRKKPIPPPNCENPGYYEGIGVCKPDALCGGPARTIKNPMNYAIRKLERGKEAARGQPRRA